MYTQSYQGHTSCIAQVNSVSIDMSTMGQDTKNK